MPESNDSIKLMKVFNPLIEPTVRSAIQALQLPTGSRGLDVGCGIGLQDLLLAEAAGPGGHVTGLDISPELLRHARENTEKAGLSEQISFKEGDASKLPFTDGTFDWAWSSDCVGYSPFIEPLPAIKELSRVVKPGGTVAIFAWSSEKLLPGYPLLEARLDATSSGIAPFIQGKKPGLHFLRALGWFREAGLRELKTRSFAGDVHAPLSDDLREALISLFTMRWSNVETELAREEWSEYQRLCLPESPEFVLNHVDYYTFFTCTMFWGRVAKQGIRATFSPQNSSFSEDKPRGSS